MCTLVDVYLGSLAAASQLPARATATRARYPFRRGLSSDWHALQLSTAPTAAALVLAPAVPCCASHWQLSRSCLAPRRWREPRPQAAAPGPCCPAAGSAAPRAAGCACDGPWAIEGRARGGVRGVAARGAHAKGVDRAPERAGQNLAGHAPTYPAIVLGRSHSHTRQPHTAIPGSYSLLA